MTLAELQAGLTRLGADPQTEVEVWIGDRTCPLVSPISLYIRVSDVEPVARACVVLRVAGVLEVSPAATDPELAQAILQLPWPTRIG